MRKDEEMFKILNQLPEEAGHIIVGKYDAAVESLGEEGIKRILKVASDDELLWPLRLMLRKRKVEVNFDTLSKLFTSLRKSNLIRAEINLCSGFEDYIFYGKRSCCRIRNIILRRKRNNVSKNKRKSNRIYS